MREFGRCSEEGLENWFPGSVAVSELIAERVLGTVTNLQEPLLPGSFCNRLQDAKFTTNLREESGSVFSAKELRDKRGC
jgi:hypothetical protein